MQSCEGRRQQKEKGLKKEEDEKKDFKRKFKMEEKKKKEMTFEPKQGSCEAKGSWKVLEVVPRKTWAIVP